MKTALYIPEGSTAPIAARLRATYDRWDSQLGENRTSWPMVDSRRVLRNENGLGLELETLPLAMPPEFVGAPLSLVFVSDDYIEANGLMKAGTYQRGQTTAIVTMRMQRSSHRGGPEPYETWKIEVTGKTLRATVKLYTDIRAGRVEPKVVWSSSTDSDD